MPDTYHPPNVNQPRVLNRWLDINAQGGPLGRTQTFITIPAFKVTGNPNDLVCVIWFTATNNFSLLDISPILDNPDYTMAIAFVDADGNTTRYGLNNPDYLPYMEPYVNQVIKKNFKIEIWSTNTTQISQSLPIVLYTSVLGNQDYRYGVDQNLSTSVLVESDFNAPLNVVPLQFPNIIFIN